MEMFLEAGENLLVNVPPYQMVFHSCDEYHTINTSCQSAIYEVCNVFVLIPVLVYAIISKDELQTDSVAK